MSVSKVVITVNSVPNAGESFTISDTGYPNITETFQNDRNNTKGIVNLNPSPSASSIAFRIFQYLNNDYNTLGIYYLSFDSGTNSITINSNKPSTTFAEAANSTGGAITMVVTNVAPAPAFTIQSIVVSQADTNPCDNVKVTVTTNEQADSIRFPLAADVFTNPFVFETARDGWMNVLLTKNGISAGVRVVAPLLLSSYFKVNVIKTPNQASVSLGKLAPISHPSNHVTYQYRLNGGAWQSSSNYSGLADGSHTIDVQDSVGCSISINFDIDAFTPNLIDYDPVVEVSNVNAFRFKLNETIINNGIRKNISNSLSFEEETEINNRNYKQLFQTGDTITTQFKTNYEASVATLIDCDGTETDLQITAVTDNMNKSDVRDGTIRLGQEDNLVGISFVAGNTYDPISLAVNGSYNLGSSLMDWINVGDWISIEAIGWFAIKGIKSPTTEEPYKTIVLNASNYDLGLTTGVTHKITTVYNSVDYNRYEFTLPMSALSGDYYIKLNVTDTDFDDKEYISEWFNVQEEQSERHFVIDYYNSENNEINYATGISYRLRIPYVLPLKWKANNEQEVFVTDTKTILIESKVREFYEFTLKPLPVAIAQKVALALSHDKISIDGITYLLEGQIEVSSLGLTNLYQLKGTLIRSDYVFENNTGLTLSEVLLPSATPLKINANADGLLLLN